MRKSILTKSIHTPNPHLNMTNMTISAYIKRQLNINMAANNNNAFKQFRMMNIIDVVEFLSHKEKNSNTHLFVY